MLHDYTTVTAASVSDVTEQAISTSESLIDDLVGVDAPRTYANTMAPLDAVAVLISDATGNGSFMARVHPDGDVRSAGVAAGERSSKWATDLVMRSDLASAVRAYAATDDAASLDGLEARNLAFWLRDLRRAGHDLNEVDRARLRELRQRLIEVQVAFNSNLDEWDDAIEMTVEDLAGLPEAYIERLAPGESEGTYRVSMAYPDYIPFIEESENRDLRRQMQFKFWNRAAEDNTPLLAEAVAIRNEIASLLGYRTWAEYAMEVKMASPDGVEALYASVVPGLTARASQELETLRSMASDDLDGGPILSWDWMYYHTQQQKQDFGIDQNEVAEFFPLETVIDGMFDITGEVLGLEYREIADTERVARRREAVRDPESGRRRTDCLLLRRSLPP